MALKTLKSRIKYRINRSKDSVFTPKDFLDLSDRDQVGRVLRQLIKDGLLIRFGYGLYAKAETSPYSGTVVPVKSLPDLAEEALLKLGVEVTESSAAKRYNAGNSTQVPTGRMIAVKGRVVRKMTYNKQSVVLERVA